MTHFQWGLLTMAVGFFMLICGTLRSKFILYQLLVARSQRLWGDAVHRFFQVAGTLVIAMGVLMALGVV